MYRMYALPVLQMPVKISSVMYITIFLIILIVIFVCLMNTKTTKEKEEKSLVVANSSKQTEYDLRMQKKHRRYNRLLRHRRVWAVLRFIKEFENIQTSENFYELDKSITEFEVAKERLYEEDYTPGLEDLSTAIRFCLHQQATHKCAHRLSKNEIEKIYDWRLFSYNKHEPLVNAAKRFKLYWDEVLESYKKQSAKCKRNEYVVNHLLEMKEKDTFLNIPNSKEIFDDLIEYYSSLPSFHKCP